MNPTRQAHLELHFAVLLYGLTAILGDLILLPAMVLVWWRVLITSISLFFLIRFGRRLLEMPKRLILSYLGIGILVALHWITFFGSVKYANASIALICYATSAFFTALLEPLLLKQPFRWYEVLLGALVIPGMALVVQSLEVQLVVGVWIGLLSAFLAVLFSVLNKRLINQAEPMSITFLEMGSSWVFISLLFPAYFWYFPEMPFWPSFNDWIYLAILALGCTTLAYVLNLRALKHLSAFAVNLALNLEPIYGILLAIIILKENRELSPSFYLGALIILATVFGYPFLKKYVEK